MTVVWMADALAALFSSAPASVTTSVANAAHDPVPLEVFPIPGSRAAAVLASGTA